MCDRYYDYKPRTFNCKHCDKQVTGRYPKTRRYCSLACGRKCLKPGKRTGQQQICEHCSGAFYVPKYRIGKTRFCCADCHNTHQGRHKKEIVCRTCGKQFRASPCFALQTYCSQECYHAHPDRQQQLVAMNQAQQQGKQTRLEARGYAMLDALGIHYIPQHLIGGKFCVDAWIPDQQTVVQFDGDYWHGNPSKYTTLDHRQAKRVRQDASQDAYFKACGYRVVRIWDSELTLERISEALLG